MSLSFSPKANYADWAIATGRRILNFCGKRGAAWSVRRFPAAVNLGFPDCLGTILHSKILIKPKNIFSPISHRKWMSFPRMNIGDVPICEFLSSAPRTEWQFCRTLIWEGASLCYKRLHVVKSAVKWSHGRTFLCNTLNLFALITLPT
jgi:hypothetical protein